MEICLNRTQLIGGSMLLFGIGALVVAAIALYLCNEFRKSISS